MPKKVRTTKKFTEKDKIRERRVKKEEVTDLINEIKDRYTPENFAAMEIKKGKVMRFQTGVTLRITKVAKGRYWAEHIELVDPTHVKGHYGHNVDTTQEAIDEFGAPYCTDCEVPVDKPATQAGDDRAADREEKTLSDGTVIDNVQES